MCFSELQFSVLSNSSFNSTNIKLLYEYDALHIWYLIATKVKFRISGSRARTVKRRQQKEFHRALKVELQEKDQIYEVSCYRYQFIILDYIRKYHTIQGTSLRF